MPRRLNPPGVDLSVKGIVLSRGEEGKTVWTLKSEKAEYLGDGGMVKVYNPTIVYHIPARDDKPAQEIRVVSPLGEVDRNGEKARLWPDVDVKYDDLAVSAQELEYFGKREVLRLSGKVWMLRPGFELFADELEISLNNAEAEAQGNVTAYLTSKEGLPR